MQINNRHKQWQSKENMGKVDQMKNGPSIEEVWYWLCHKVFTVPLVHLLQPALIPIHPASNG